MSEGMAFNEFYILKDGIDLSIFYEKLDLLDQHSRIAPSGWRGCVIVAYPEYPRIKINSSFNSAIFVKQENSEWWGAGEYTEPQTKEERGKNE